jgi:tetratricopeptide (TPR) repeat protein
MGAMHSLCRKAWAEFLRGRLDDARDLYDTADRLQMELDGRHLYSQRGVQFAVFLLRTGEQQRARALAVANLDFSRRNDFIRTIGQSQRVLADLDMRAGDHVSAGRNYEEALTLARRTSHLPALMEALVARGTWKTLTKHGDSGRADLEEALTYAAEGAYASRGDVTLRYAHAGGYLRMASNSRSVKASITTRNLYHEPSFRVRPSSFQRRDTTGQQSCSD